MENKQIYVIIMIEKFIDSYSVEPLGVYTDLELALNYADELENEVKPPSGMKGKKPVAVFDILEFDIDEEPLLLKHLKQDSKNLESGVQKMIVSLMKKGYVDQLIGEDGHFYYVLTESGKDIVRNLPPHIKKYFDNN